jgi:hypothetical protein
VLRAAHLRVSPYLTAVLSKRSENECRQLRGCRCAWFVPGLSAADQADAHNGGPDSVDQVRGVHGSVGGRVYRPRSGILTEGTWAKDGAVRGHHSAATGEGGTISAILA